MMDGFALSAHVPFGRSSNPKEYQMTELKLSTAAEVTKPVEKVVTDVREEVKVPAVELPSVDGSAPKPAEKVVPQV